MMPGSTIIEPMPVTYAAPPTTMVEQFAYAQPTMIEQPMTYAAPPMTYAAPPTYMEQAVTYEQPMTYAAPPMTYAAPPTSMMMEPQMTYAAPPMTYAAPPMTYAAPPMMEAPMTYAAPAPPPVHEVAPAILGQTRQSKVPTTTMKGGATSVQAFQPTYTQERVQGAPIVNQE